MECRGEDGGGDVGERSDGSVCASSRRLAPDGHYSKTRAQVTSGVGGHYSRGSGSCKDGGKMDDLRPTGEYPQIHIELEKLVKRGYAGICA